MQEKTRRKNVKAGLQLPSFSSQRERGSLGCGMTWGGGGGGGIFSRASKKNRNLRTEMSYSRKSPKSREENQIKGQ